MTIADSVSLVILGTGDPHDSLRHFDALFNWSQVATIKGFRYYKIVELLNEKPKPVTFCVTCHS